MAAEGLLVLDDEKISFNRPAARQGSAYRYRGRQ